MIIVTDCSRQMLDLARANPTRTPQDERGVAMRPNQVEIVQANAMDLSSFSNRTLE